MTIKKYLTKPEDVLALKDTDTKIYIEGMEGYYQFIQGALCYFDDDDAIMMFSKFGIGKGYLMVYILVEEPVKEADENDIGYLCWFWDKDEDSKSIGTLTKILTNNPYSFLCRAGCFRHCRRLTPAEVAEITGYKAEE